MQDRLHDPAKDSVDTMPLLCYNKYMRWAEARRRYHMFEDLVVAVGIIFLVGYTIAELLDWYKVVGKFNRKFFEGGIFMITFAIIAALGLGMINGTFRW